MLQGRRDSADVGLRDRLKEQMQVLGLRASFSAVTELEKHTLSLA